MSQRITIDPITRLEGHGRIEIFLDDQGEVSNAYLQIGGTSLQSKMQDKFNGDEDKMPLPSAWTIPIDKPEKVMVPVEVIPVAPVIAPALMMPALLLFKPSEKICPPVTVKPLALAKPIRA